MTEKRGGYCLKVYPFGPLYHFGTTFFFLPFCSRNREDEREIVGMIISYFYFKFHSKLSLWYDTSNLPTVKIFFVENKIKGEVICTPFEIIY